MELPRFVIEVTFDQWLMIALTVVIATAVIAQAVYTGRQARLLAETEQRHANRERPWLRITLLFNPVQGENDEVGNPTWIRYVGFTVVNASLFDITVTHIDLELGIPIANKMVVTPAIWLQPARRYGDSKLSDVSLPHRLRPGESFRVLYEESHVVETLVKKGRQSPARVRPRCRDSLGNSHKLDHWIVWEANGGATSFSDPGPGYVTEEEWMGSS